MKESRVHLRTEPTVKRLWEREAEKRHLTLSEFIHEAVREYIEFGNVRVKKEAVGNAPKKHITYFK
jgi:hypothetical protein